MESTATVWRWASVIVYAHGTVSALLPGSWEAGLDVEDILKF
jgi:hypothetical protein